MSSGGRIWACVSRFCCRKGEIVSYTESRRWEEGGGEGRKKAYPELEGFVEEDMVVAVFVLMC